MSWGSDGLFRKESYFEPSKTAEKGADLEAGQTRALPPKKAVAPLIRPVPSKRDLEDWVWALRDAAHQAADLRGGEALSRNLDDLEARLLPFL